MALATVPLVVALLMTGTIIVQPPTAIDAPLAYDTLLAVVVTDAGVHVPEVAPLTVTPAGSVSVKICVSVIAAALALPSVIVKDDVPPTGMTAGVKLLAIVGKAVALMVVGSIVPLFWVCVCTGVAPALSKPSTDTSPTGNPVVALSMLSVNTAARPVPVALAWLLFTPTLAMLVR